MSRSDARADALRRRPSRTVPSVIVALLLLSLGVALVWVSVLRLSSGTWPGFLAQPATWMAGLTWASTALLVIAGVVVLLGVVLILCAVVPGQPTALRIDAEPLEGGSGSSEVAMTRRSVAKLARARADEIDGVDSVSTTVGAHSVTMSVTTPSGQRGEIQETVTSAVRAALHEAGLDPMPRIATKARTQGP